MTARALITALLLWAVIAAALVLWLGPFLKRRSRDAGQQIGGCKACKRTWLEVQYHITDYGDGYGCLPLCETCWAGLTPEQRLPYYRALIATWGSDHMVTTWPAVEQAVMEGK